MRIIIVWTCQVNHKGHGKGGSEVKLKPGCDDCRRKKLEKAKPLALRMERMESQGMHTDGL